ncbi:DNA polymerase subunit Cdc27 [Coniochaeta sp. 2T2.1]|nr:DNA polymerase subunit Cdc27 [Coniochaeta sp. 2T2.1]
MDEYKNYLAENILSEDKAITYRVLSRALKVHVNTAKQMLYDFHKWQNGKRAGSVHATYLVYGTKKDDHAGSQQQPSQDGDIDMMSSAPEPEAEEDVVPVQTLAIVSEEELKGALEAYEEVNSFHVYSLGPHPVKDMALLSDANRQIHTLAAPGGSPSSIKIYGTITNKSVRRRERRGPGARLAAAPVATIKAAAPKVEPKAAAKPVAATPKVKEEAKDAEKVPTPAPSASTSSATGKKGKPSLQRAGSSAGSGGLMAAFAKGAAARAKKAESQPATPSGDESSVQPMSEDEEDDSAVLPKPKVPEDAAAKSRAQQSKEELQRMMEQESEDEEVKEKEDTPMEEPEPEQPAPEPEKEEPAEVVASSGDGRRRGKRKVMKARRFLDEEGNMVTVREPVWEEFSEDEAPPKTAPKPKPTSSAPAAKGKKAAPKGQGSIMSFFNKKT